MWRSRIIALVIVIGLGVGLAPTFATLASPRSETGGGRPSEIGPDHCQDEKVIAMLGADLKGVSAAFKKADPDSVKEIAQLLLTTQQLRRKWETLPDIPDICITLQLRTVVLFATGGDIATLMLASNTDKDNAAQYDKKTTLQADRYTRVFNDLMRLIPPEK